MATKNWQWAITTISNLENVESYRKDVINNRDAINKIGVLIAMAFIAHYSDKNKATFDAYVSINDRLFNINRTIHDHWQRNVSDYIADVISSIYG